MRLRRSGEPNTSDSSGNAPEGRFPAAGYWIFTAKMMTADWLGVRVPTVALMVPAVPFAGATMDPTVVLAGGTFR